MKKSTLSLAIIAAILISGGLMLKLTEKTAVKVFHAGSLTLPFERIEKEFERVYNIDVQLEPSGSVVAIRKITELGQPADVLASADYSLIQDMMVPEYADWYIKFARNHIVIAYTDGSKYASKIDNQNWYEILGRPDVKFGFADPNCDPCGYRALLTIQLAELHYGNGTIFDDLIETNTSIAAVFENNKYTINAPENPAPNTARVRIELKSVDLVSFLELGTLDYAFEYRSVAEQRGLEFLELPPQIDLGSGEYENTYKNVSITLQTTGKTVTARPIVYDITIPKSARHADLAIDFVKLVISETGEEILRNLGHDPIAPAVASDASKIPRELRSLVSP